MLDWTELRRALIPDETRTVLPPRVKLPVLPRAITEFSRKAEEPDASPAELACIIETDAGLTCDLLRHVNSSAYAMRSKASSALQAITMLGVRETRLVLIAAAMKRAMRACESKLINFPNFWAANLERGLFARELATLLKANGELAYAGGMLQDFLLPIVTNQMFPAYLRFSSGQTSNPIALPDFERTEHGWDHAEAAARVMTAWGFPDDLVCCVYLHHRGLKLLKDPELARTAAAAVAVAGLMPDPFEQIPDGMAKLIRLEQAWPALNLIEIARRVQRQFELQAPGFSNHFSFLRRCEKALSAAHAS